MSEIRDESIAEVARVSESYRQEALAEEERERDVMELASEMANHHVSEYYGRCSCGHQFMSGNKGDTFEDKVLIHFAVAMYNAGWRKQ